MSTVQKLADIKEKVLKYEQISYMRRLPLALHPLLQIIPILGNLIVFIQTCLVVRRINKAVKIPFHERCETWVSVSILLLVGMVPILGLALTIYCTHCSDHLNIAMHHLRLQQQEAKEPADIEAAVEETKENESTVSLVISPLARPDTAQSFKSTLSKKSSKSSKRHGSVASKHSKAEVEKPKEPAQMQRQPSVFNRVSKMPWMEEIMAISPTDNYRTSLSTNMFARPQTRYMDIHDLATRNSKMPLPKASPSLVSLPSYLTTDRKSLISNDDMVIGFNPKRATKSLHLDDSVLDTRNSDRLLKRPDYSHLSPKEIKTKFLWSKDAANSAAKSQFTYRKWTKRDISQYTGANNQPILIALDGKVYDVSLGRGFYGPGCAYNVFAGRDASRLLAKQEFDDGMTDAELDAPIDNLHDLTEEDREALDSYIGLFSVKYHCVGELVEP
ncbi:Dihydrodipicolinate synthase [Coemansia sp. RSA 1086]|nr:Dihydrodipicolinate synthase [Coemansia sp. RSA 1086]